MERDFSYSYACFSVLVAQASSASLGILRLSPGQDPAAAAPGLVVQILEIANSQELGADSVWPEGRGHLGPDS